MREVAPLDVLGQTRQLDATGGVADKPISTNPNPALVTRALVALGGNPDESLLVGDSVSDIHAAMNAGVCAVGLANRPYKGEQLAHAGAVSVVADIAQLTAELISAQDR